MRWVRNQKAIDTIVALKMIQPGDEIFYRKPKTGTGISNLRDRYVYAVRQPKADEDRIGEEANWWGESEVILGILDNKKQTNGHYFTRTNIRAWRRPKQ